MNLEKLNHFAITTCELDETIRFYHDVLGFTVESVLDDEHTRTVFMAKNGVCRIELIKKKPQSDTTMGMFDHIAIDVDDVRGMEERLRSSGVEILQTSTEISASNTRLLKLLDPNGICIALREDIV